MDYPDSEEEFELMHADEFENMRDMDDIDNKKGPPSKPKSKRSLDFGDSTRSNNIPTSSKKNMENAIFENGGGPYSSATSTDHGLLPLETSCKRITPPDDCGDNVIQSNKRARVLEEEADLDGPIDPEVKQEMLIDRIVQLRKKTNEFTSTLHCQSTDYMKTVFRSEYMTRKVPQWNFMPVSGFGERRIYLRLRSEDYLKTQMENYGKEKMQNGNYLLHNNFMELLDKAKEEREKLFVRKEEYLNKRKEFRGSSSDSDLWVSVHQPKSYLQLLSDESINRLLLHWVKLWDKVVFGRNVPIFIKKHEEFNSHHKILSDELDEYGRPAFHKIALLCGPPGLGKTTLAHLVAKHAGYNIVEVNASDDRSPQMMRTQLEAATQMKAVMGDERKPNCLILDEIDGAPLATIDVLVKFVQGKEAKKKKKKMGEGKKEMILRRPIICICNDVYVPALRPLRQIALTLHVPSTSCVRLAERLVEICNERKIKADLGTMMTLAEKSHNDIRSCLSVLQTISSSSNHVTLSQIMNSKVGEKDVQESLFTIWQKIFHIPKPKIIMTQDGYSRNQKVVKESPHSFAESGSLHFRMTEVLRAVHGCGDYERLTQGVYENIPNMTMKPISMNSLSKSLEWFLFNDLITSSIQSSQIYTLYPYLQYAFAFWHFIFASMSWPKLSYPSSGYEVFSRIKRVKEVLDYMVNGASPVVRIFFKPQELLLDTLSFLLEIIVPNLRSASLQLFSSYEKNALSQVVSIMIDYNLNYTQERTEDGVYSFNLDPNIEGVCRFKDNGIVGKSLTYSCKQLIAHEISLEKMRRAESCLYRDSNFPANSKDSDSKGQNDSLSQESVKDSSRSVVKNQESPANKTTSSHLQKLTPKALKKVSDKPVRDFFGRVVTPSRIAAKNKDTADNFLKSDVWFHFKEGHNNAVRRTVYIKDLLIDPNQASRI